MQNISKKTILILLISLVVTLFLAVYAIPQVLITLTRAAPAGSVSLNQSILLGNNLLAKADGKDPIKVSVFLRDKDGKAVAARNVILTGLPENGTDTKKTNSEGLAEFVLTSKVAGQFTLSAMADNLSLANTVIVTFR